MFETCKWLESLESGDKLKVFKILSGYLSTTEIKKVIAASDRGDDLLSIHRDMGLLKKYNVDLIRIRGLIEKNDRL